jgi:hypothetical protein
MEPTTTITDTVIEHLTPLTTLTNSPIKNNPTHTQTPINRTSDPNPFVSTATPKPIYIPHPIKLEDFPYIPTTSIAALFSFTIKYQIMGMEIDIM